MMSFTKQKKKPEPKVEAVPPPSVDELARMVEKRDRLSAEYSAASMAVDAAIKAVPPGAYIAADGGVVRVYLMERMYDYMYGLERPKLVEFKRPLREIKPE